MLNRKTYIKIQKNVDKTFAQEYTKKRGEDVSEVTPVPIPNTEVKLEIAENSKGMPLVKIGFCHVYIPL